MCEEIIKKIYHISKEYQVDKIEVFTNHLKFCGKLCECKEEKKDEYVLTLTEAKVWRVKDLCLCNDPECKCNEGNFSEIDWLHINVDKVVAFNLKK